MKVKFYMDCGYPGTEDEEIVEFDDDVTQIEIDEALTEWFWNNFWGSCGWDYVK